MLERTSEVSLADFRMLSAVAEGEARASRLAARLALGKPAVSSSVDSLVRRGLLERETHDLDQRAVDLSITAEGERVRASAESALMALVAELVDRAPDPTATLRALAELDEAIEDRQRAVVQQRRADAVGATHPGSSATERPA